MFTFSDISLFIILITISLYFYYQNRILINDINKEKETENLKQSFLATLVHDLKTPTNAQLNTLNMLKNEQFGKLNSQQQEMITLTHESCKYMSNLIGTIMQTYSCEAGKIQLNKTEFDIAQVVVKLCDETKSLRQQKNLSIKFNNETNNSLVYADKLQVERVIMNLLSNAITYSFQNTVIEINLKNTQTNVELSIKNISKPIPQKELLTIFDKYKKTNFAKYNNAGNGLGLYLSKRVIELHQGKIYAKSFADGTCIFGFTLPADKHSKNLNDKINTVHQT